MFGMGTGILCLKEQANVCIRYGLERKRNTDFRALCILCGLHPFIPLFFICRVFGHFYSAEIIKIITPSKSVPKNQNYFYFHLKEVIS